MGQNPWDGPASLVERSTKATALRLKPGKTWWRCVAIDIFANDASQGSGQLIAKQQDNDIV